MGNTNLVSIKDPLSVTHPDIAEQAEGWDPTIVVAGSAQKKLWKCELGHIWEQVVRDRIRKNSKGLCPTCDSKTLLVGFNDLETTNPDLINSIDGWDPKTVTSGSVKKMSWICPLGHKWQATVHARARLKRGCPFCTHVLLLTGFNDLKTHFPFIASEADGWDPSLVITGSKSKRKWKCKEGHTWETTVNSRCSRNTHCNYCNGRLVDLGRTDLATTYPELALEADGWDPTTVVAGSRKQVKWKCKLGHTWITSVESRARLGRGCGTCSGMRVLSGFNDIATTHPEIAKRMIDSNPEEFSAGSEKRAKWKCDRGHIWEAQVKQIVSSGRGCPYCANYKVLAGFNDFATKHPSLALEADGWDPSTVVSGSAVMKPWKCPEGHKYKTRVSSRDSRNSGCPTCAKSGFDPNSNGWLYLLIHPNWEMLQIGITNYPDDRLKSHKRLGWKLVELRGPMDGLITREWETSILQMLRRHGAKLAPEEVAGKFDGYTEAWLLDSLRVKSLKDLMDMVREDE
jgi:hypothetical protein